MAAFNVVQRRRRATMADNKRDKHGDPVTRKLKQRPQTIPISGSTLATDFTACHFTTTAVGVLQGLATKNYQYGRKRQGQSNILRAGKLPGDTTSLLKAWWQSHSK